MILKPTNVVILPSNQTLGADKRTRETSHDGGEQGEVQYNIYGLIHMVMLVAILEVLSSYMHWRPLHRSIYLCSPRLKDIY